MGSTDNGHLGRIFEDEDSSILMNACNNNNKSAQNSVQQTQQQLPLTPQLSRARNFISDMVNFSPMNGIMSQDNASGELGFKLFSNHNSQQYQPILVVFDIYHHYKLHCMYLYIYITFIIIHKIG